MNIDKLIPKGEFFPAPEGFGSLMNIDKLIPKKIANLFTELGFGSLMNIDKLILIT